MRLDSYLAAQLRRFDSRTKAREAIERGEVLVNGKRVKPSYTVLPGDDVTFVEDAGLYVSNGAFKLQKAFDVFDFSVRGKTVADVGASTGGFTQCLLMHGAKTVYAIDVGDSLLHPSLRSDERVVAVDRFNARNLTVQTLGGTVDAIVSDVSFISLTYLLGGFYAVLTEGVEAVLLVKPQFECGQKFLSKNGIVTDPSARADACLKVAECAVRTGFSVLNFTYAPLREGKNTEFLIHLKKGGAGLVSAADILSVCINLNKFE